MAESEQVSAAGFRVVKDERGRLVVRENAKACIVVHDEATGEHVRVVICDIELVPTLTAAALLELVRSRLLEAVRTLQVRKAMRGMGRQ